MLQILGIPEKSDQWKEAKDCLSYGDRYYPLCEFPNHVLKSNHDMYDRSWEELLRRRSDKKMGNPKAKAMNKSRICADFITNYVTSLNPIANESGTILNRDASIKQVFELPFRTPACFYKEFFRKCQVDGMSSNRIAKSGLFYKVLGQWSKTSSYELRYLRCKGNHFE
jgi:hypothetical protein